jgi:hypothetical protein
MNLDHLDELLQYVPEPMLDAYSKGKNPRVVPPWAAAAALSEKVAEKQANTVAQGAAQGPQPSVMDQLRQKAATLNTQAQMQQNQGQGGLPGMLPQPRMQPQAEPDVQMAASGGLMGVPVRGDMFGMAGGGIVSFEAGGSSADAILRAYLKEKGITTGEFANLSPDEQRAERIKAGAVLPETAPSEPAKPKDARASTRMERGIRGVSSAGSAVNTGANAASGMLNKAAGPLAAVSLLPELYGTSPEEVAKLKATEKPGAIGRDTPDQNMVERLITGLFSPSERKAAVAPAADAGPKAIPIPVDRPQSSVSAGEGARQAEYARLIKQGMPPEMAAKAAGMSTATPAAAAPKTGLPGMLQQRPPTAGPAAGPAAGGLPTALDTYNRDPAVAFARTYLSESPTLPAVTKDFGEYQQQQEAKLRQAGVKPGEAPWELAQKDMAEIQARRAKEDAAREKTKEGRSWDELMEFSSGLTGSNFGAGMARGSKASRELRQRFQADDESYAKMRDEQDTKLKEMNRLAMGAKFDLANGRIKEHDQKLAKRDELMAEYRKNQATLAGSVSTGAATAAAADQTAAGQRYSADRQASASGASNVMAQKRLEQDSLKALESNIVSELNKLPTFGPGKEKRAALEAELSRVRKALGAIGGYTMGETPGAGSPGGAKTGWGKAQVVK